MAQARQELATELVERGADWRIGVLPVLQGDRDTLQAAITNLLSNAVKFTGGQSQALIEVWAEHDERHWRVFVRDDGVGFDPQYASKLFGIFQRLHRADGFEGIGVGLANVRRVVHRHGGTVFAEGTPGVGATFGFTLPKPG